MGLRSVWRRGRRAEAGTAVASTGPWYDELARSARLHGAYPYLVEGFVDIVDAVRRGHAVLVRRAAAEVADGVRVFDTPAGEQPQAQSAPLEQIFGDQIDEVVTIVRFDPGTARFVLQDVGNIGSSVQLTPKRLQRYLAECGCEVGVALGA